MSQTMTLSAMPLLAFLRDLRGDSLPDSDTVFAVEDARVRDVDIVLAPVRVSPR
jgi:hypothetical protein